MSEQGKQGDLLTFEEKFGSATKSGFPRDRLLFGKKSQKERNMKN